jgi:hypothetical protein
MIVLMLCILIIAVRQQKERRPIKGHEIALIKSLGTALVRASPTFPISRSK